MTFDNDVIRLIFDGNSKLLMCKSIGLEWPPPERITFLTFEMKRIRMSTLTDEQRAECEFICRGAEYVPVTEF